MLLRLAGVLTAVTLAACRSNPPQDTRQIQDPPDKKVAPDMDGSHKGGAGKAGHGTVEFRLGYYDNDDGPGEGNPFLDESLTVIEPVLYLDYNLTDQVAWWTKISYDNVSSASIKRLDRYPGTEQSGASGDYYIGLDVGRREAVTDHLRNDVWVHGSTEYDYTSFGLGGSVSWDAADRNTTDKISGNFFYDDLDLIRFNGREEGTDQRLSLTLGWTRYQVMTAERHAEFGVSLTWQDGFLSTPYNAVVLEDPSYAPNPQLDNNARGVEISERLPDTRIRGALHGRVRQHVGTGTALELGGRLYADDWGVNSIAIEPRVYHWLVRDVLRGRFRYRYYTQTAADDFQERFTEADRNREFLTQDSDLGSFDSHTVGIGLTWNYDADVTLHFASDYVKRSDDIDQVFASIGLTWRF